nr:hypothetical protein [Tanacetum cinerariifolium]
MATSLTIWKGPKKTNKQNKLQLAARGQNQWKWKNKLAYALKPKIPPPRKKENIAKDSVYHQCSDTGILTIELYTFPNKSSVYDTSCGTHICNTTQGLRGSRKLNPRALSLYMGNVSRNNLVYFSVVQRDDIFEIDLSDNNTNDSSIKKRIEKLQHDGLLNSTDLRAFEIYVSCMSGKMARKPYTHQVERAKDLLGLIDIDVCGPFRIVSRQEASYFVTFTNEFGRYGYVYLLLHKHEVFKTFKVFQKEIENQLRKTIKLLHSAHGGEYMIQEVLDHLKEHGIITHYTPPYTPQHNGTSKRRNRTLLEIVRSMMSQITLLKSFRDYAFKTVARIFNMVPTKKVQKTPYKVWHGQASKLSYLKVWGSEALVKRDTLTKSDKLEPRSSKCIFVGYLMETMGYSFYYPPRTKIPNGNNGLFFLLPTKNKVLVAQNAKFLENSLITQEASGSYEDVEIIQEEDTHPSINTSSHHKKDDLEIDEPKSDIITIRRMTRT